MLNLIKIFSKATSKVAELSQLLDRLEKYPVRFTADKEQVVPFEAYLSDAREFESDDESGELARRIIALQYRLEGVNGGLDQERAPVDAIEQLIEKAASWIKRVDHVAPMEKSELRVVLNDVANYSRFLNLALKHEKISGELFEWVIRNNISAVSFIEFPALATKIVESNFHIRVGYFDTLGLKVKKGEEKIVTLPINGEDVSVLDETLVITFKGNWELTIAEIFDIFKLKNYKVGNLEYTEIGIINWNVHEWGYWNNDSKEFIRIDLEKSEWWKQLPVFRTMTLDKATEKFGKGLDGKNWGIAARTARTATDLELLGNHAFFEVYVPVGDGLTYQMLPMGKYANGLPLTFSAVEGISFLCDMSAATIAYIDENIFYTFREHAQYSFTVTPEEGHKYMDVVKRDMNRGYAGNLVYQIETENCAQWVNQTLVEVLGEENVPNLFKLNFLETTSAGPIGWAMNGLRRLPKNWQAWLVTRLHIPLGAYKGSWVEDEDSVRWVSLMTVSFWEDAKIYFPSFLNHQIEKGLLVAERVIKAIAETASYFIEAIIKFISYFVGKKPATRESSRPDNEDDYLDEKNILTSSLESSLSRLESLTTGVVESSRTLLCAFLGGRLEFQLLSSSLMTITFFGL